MAKILYSATTADGSKTAGFVDAMSAALARDDLVRRGLRDVVLHLAPAVPQPDSELAGLSQAEVRALAQFKLRALRSPGMPPWMGEVAAQAPGEPSRTRDHALVLAPSGDVAQAGAPLASIDGSLLPPQATQNTSPR